MARKLALLLAFLLAVWLVGRLVALLAFVPICCEFVCLSVGSLVGLFDCLALLFSALFCFVMFFLLGCSVARSLSCSLARLLPCLLVMPIMNQPWANTIAKARTALGLLCAAVPGCGRR